VCVCCARVCVCVCTHEFVCEPGALCRDDVDGGDELPLASLSDVDGGDERPRASPAEPVAHTQL
jgi:hypothetical protein